MDGTRFGWDGAYMGLAEIQDWKLELILMVFQGIQIAHLIDLTVFA